MLSCSLDNSSPPNYIVRSAQPNTRPHDRHRRTSSMDLHHAKSPALPSRSSTDNSAAVAPGIDLLCINDNLDENSRTSIRRLIGSSYSQSALFATEPLNFSMQIRLKSDQPIYSRPRRLSFEEKKQVQDMVADLLKSGCIRPSNSQYASPIVLVKKKSGDIRMCVDYRAINKLTYRDNYPLPLIEDCLLARNC